MVRGWKDYEGSQATEEVREELMRAIASIRTNLRMCREVDATPLEGEIAMFFTDDDVSFFQTENGIISCVG